MRIDVAPATPDAIGFIADHMSERDRAEVWAYSGRLPHAALQRAVDLSHEPEVALYDGEPVAAFGCAPYGEDGTPWLLSTERLAEAPRAVLTIGHEKVQAYASIYPRLINFVHWKNLPSLRWLERLGFVIEPPQPTGRYGVPFHRIVRCAI